MKRMIASLLIFTQLAYAGRLQDADFKTEAELVAAGSSAAQLLNDSKVYITANGLNKKLSTAITDGDIGAASNPDNKLSNPGFEKGTTGWTESGGTLASTSTASEVLEGTKAITWDSSSAAQTLTGTAITVGGFAGQNAELTCNVRVPSGTATHTLGVWDGTTLSNAVTLRNTSGNTNYVATTINFIAPSSGTVTARFTSVASNEPSISIDDCYLGKARNIGTVQQAIVYGSALYPTTTNCNWQSTSTAFASFATDADCPTPTVTGNASAPATKIPAITFASLPPGEYEVTVRGSLRDATLDTNGCTFAISDGTNRIGQTNIYQGANMGSVMENLTTRVRYTAPQSNVTFQVVLRSDNAANTCQLSINDTPNEQSLEFIVKQFPLSSQQAVSSAQSDYDWTSYGTTSDFTGFGTVSSISLQHRRIGSDLEIRGKFTSGVTTATEARIALPSGLTSSDTSRIPSLQMAGQLIKSAGASTTNFAYFTLIEPSVTYITFGDQTSTRIPLSKRNGNDSFTNGDQISFTAKIPIQGWSNNQRAPVLVGSVTSNSSGAERIERVKVGTASCTTNPCNISSTSGGISSITRQSTGKYNLNFSSGFSSAPTCTCTSHDFGVQATFCSAPNNSVTPSTTQWGFETRNYLNSLVDTSFDIICIGPR